MFQSVVNAYNEAIIDADQDRALQVIHDAAAAGASPNEIIFRVIIPAIEQMIRWIGGNPDANLAQNFLMARVGAMVTDEMLRKIDLPPAVAGRIVIGTAMGDMHSLGKSIVSGCLKAQMFKVIDLGSSVSPERFVDEAIAHDAHVIGISSMMVHTALGENGCLGVRRILNERGLQNRIKIIVGGTPYSFDPELCQMVQADAWAQDGISAGKIISDLIKGVPQ
jgi:methylmalonyl-CoA mutase cobalamin-binding domain/chain